MEMLAKADMETWPFHQKVYKWRMLGSLHILPGPQVQCRPAWEGGRENIPKEPDREFQGAAGTFPHSLDR